MTSRTVCTARYLRVKRSARLHPSHERFRLQCERRCVHHRRIKTPRTICMRPQKSRALTERRVWFLQSSQADLTPVFDRKFLRLRFEFETNMGYRRKSLKTKTARTWLPGLDSD